MNRIITGVSIKLIMNICWLSTLFLFLLSNQGMAQKKDHAAWKISSVRLNEGEAMIAFQVTLDSGWHLYSQHVRVNEVALQFIFDESKQYLLLEGVREESRGIFRFDPLFKQSLTRFENCASFSQRIKVGHSNTIVNGMIQFTIGCDNEQPIREVLRFSAAVSVKAAREKIAAN